MSFKIKCYTLFNVTQTGVLNRSKQSLDDDYQIWMQKRNTQANFDTILQVINLRSQPENISIPKKMLINLEEFDNFGFLYEQIDDIKYPCWTFNFEIQHKSVFDDGKEELGLLISDCHGVPMILCGDEHNKISSFLDSSPELKNIYFKIDDE